MRATTALRKILAEPGCTMSVSAHDPLLARLVEQTGFKVVGLSGNAIAAAYLGMPDMGFLNLGDMVNVARRIAAAVDVNVAFKRFRSGIDLAVVLQQRAKAVSAPEQGQRERQRSAEGGARKRDEGRVSPALRHLTRRRSAPRRTGSLRPLGPPHHQRAALRHILIRH